MIVLGPLVLLAVGALAVSGITTGHGAHSPSRRGLLGYCLTGPGSRLFFVGLLLAAAAMFGLARIATRLGRGVRRFPASRQLPRVPPGPLLLAAWHGEDAGTEELRTAVRHYRAFGNRLADFSRET
jgi:hypothetical protein